MEINLPIERRNRTVRLIAFNLSIAFVASVAVLPVWLIAPLRAPYLQLLVELIILPAILCVFNVIMFLRRSVPSLGMLYVIIPVSCVVAVGVSYLNWGISSGELFTPDWETLHLIRWFAVFSGCISALLWGITHFALWNMKRASITAVFTVGVILLIGLVANLVAMRSRSTFP